MVMSKTSVVKSLHEFSAVIASYISYGVRHFQCTFAAIGFRLLPLGVMHLLQQERDFW